MRFQSSAVLLYRESSGFYWTQCEIRSPLSLRTIKPLHTTNTSLWPKEHRILGHNTKRASPLQMTELLPPFIKTLHHMMGKLSHKNIKGFVDCLFNVKFEPCQSFYYNFSSFCGTLMPLSFASKFCSVYWFISNIFTFTFTHHTVHIYIAICLKRR